MNMKPIAMTGLLAAVLGWTGCATRHCDNVKKFSKPKTVHLKTMVSLPVGGVLTSNKPQSGLPSNCAKLVCNVVGTDHGTQWWPFVGSAPSNPPWLNPIPGDAQFPNVNQSWNVMFKTNGTATPPGTLYNVFLEAGKKTKMTVSYVP